MCHAGWHPLTASLVNSFRPNCTSISTDKGRVVVLTGPNCSGKSVYLEQVGIIVYLAHIGCFVPAQSARVGLVDRILTRMEYNRAQNPSFAKDLVQLSTILKASTSHSLLLIDEFGKVCCWLIDGTRL
jgi:DNA mismatch repair protein MSH5